MKKLILTCLLCVLSLKVFALGSGDPLLPDEAFKFSAQVISPERLRVEWNIADGYYLYRNKISFSSSTPAVLLNEQQIAFPAGKIKNDPNLGDMEIYTKHLSVEIPYQLNDPKANQLSLVSNYQGCADGGICYPPQHKTLNLQLAAADTTTEPQSRPDQAIKVNASASANSPKPNGLKALLGNNQQGNKTLAVEEAFQFSLIPLDQKTLIAHWDVQPDHHLYRAKIKFNLISPKDAQLGEPIFPPGLQVDDEFFGKMEVFNSNLDASIPITLPADFATRNEKLIIQTEYQGCSDKTGICYPPVQQESVIEDMANLPVAVNNAQLVAQNVSTATPSTTVVEEEASANYYDQMKTWGLFGTIAAFFGVGLILAFTPCVFPMIPILSGVIVGQTNMSARKAFFLSLAYVLASASAYAIIGIFFGIFGENLQAILQHPVAVGSFAALFVLLALSMFGFYDLQLPNSLQSRLNELSNRQQGGSLVGAAIMGFLSTLIVGPCVAPPLAGALTYIAQTKDAFLGGIALFSMGFAMGLPLLIVGTSAGHLLPRAGAWMDTTKAIFGIMMLGLAIWMLNRIMPPHVTMILTGILFVASGIYMGALDRIDGGTSGWTRFWKSIGLILLFYGTLLLLGAAFGTTNLSQPLKGIFGTVNTQTTSSAKKLNFEKIHSIAELDSALAAAKDQQITLLDFYADWCTDCIRMDKNTFTDANVLAGLEGIKVLKADVTQQNQQDEALQKKYGVVGPPTFLFFDKKGNEIKSLRLVGYENAENFTERLQRLANR